MIEAATATRSRVALGFAAGAVVLLLAGCVVGAVQTIREQDTRADANSGLDFADRDVAWGNGWTLSQGALYAARSAIPKGADYEVLLGDESLFSNPLTHPFAPSYLHYWLMPGHEVGGARWVVCFRCDRAALGSEARTLWEDSDAGVSIVDRNGVKA